MTDRGTRVRWTTAALVAPTAAALFTGTTVWAAGHQPTTGSTATKPAPTPTATVDPAVQSLQSAVAANTKQVAKLRATVVALQKQAAALVKHPAKASSSGSGGSSTKSWSGGSSRKTSGGSSSGSRTVTRTVTVTKTVAAPPSTTSGGS